MKGPSRIGSFVVSFLLVAGVTTGAVAQTYPMSSIPSYYSMLQWDLTSPSAYSTAAGGYANPAVYGTLRGGEAQFIWSDEANSSGNLDDWGLFFGGPHIGFGVIRNEIPVGGGQTVGVNDLRIALAGGEHNTSIGFGFGWSTGDDDAVGRSNILQIGLVHRFGRYVSIGASGDFALNNGNQQGLFDVAARPLGTQMLTVFGDLELPKGSTLDNAPWSAGAMVEPVPGLQLIGRYFEDESYAFSLGFGFGALGLYGTPRYDKDGDRTNTTWQVRTGYPQRSIFDQFAYKDRYYLDLNLKGPVKYRKYKWFDTGGNSLLDLERDLDYARTDPAISGVAINMAGMMITRGKAWELREKLVQIRAAGKHVVVYAEELGMTEYHLASVADRIVLDPEGLVLLPGYVMGRTFIKDMLVKLGIGFDEWRFLKYKSAAEAFSRTDMSPADREQRLALIEDFYATTRSDVTSSRGVSPATFDTWINDDVLLSPKQALDQRVVTDLGRWDDVRNVIEELEGSRKRYWPPSMLAENHYPSDLWGENPEIAVVYALGYCGMETGIRARSLEKVMKKVTNDRWTKAVVVRVDSPGGLALASDLVAERIKECAKKKPVIISQGDVAASGGYWLSMYGTEIYAEPQTIVGSIGVIGGWVWNDGLGEKIGHTSDYVKVGDKAAYGFGIRLLLGGPMLPDRNLSPEERKEVIDEMETFYDNFVAKVASGRRMTVAAVDSIAQGRVFSGTAGLEVGLVDKIGTLDAAIKAAKKAAGIKDDDPITIEEYPELGFNFKMFREAMSPYRWFGSKNDDDQVADAELEFMRNPEWMYLRALVENPGRALYMLPPEYNVQDARWGRNVSE